MLSKRDELTVSIKVVQDGIKDVQDDIKSVQNNVQNVNDTENKLLIVLLEKEGFLMKKEESLRNELKSLKAGSFSVYRYQCLLSVYLRRCLD